MRFSQSLCVLLLGAWLGPVGGLVADDDPRASAHGSYFVMPGVLAEFEFDEDHVQCKIPRTVLPDGTDIYMLMTSTAIDTMSIDRAAKTVVITGKTMTSLTELRFPDGSSATLSEAVPFVVNAKDNDTPGAGSDTFSLTVTYDPNAPESNGLNQYKFFKASPANPQTTFGGVLESGEVEVRDEPGPAKFFFAVNSGGGNTADRINLNGSGTFGIGFVKGGGTFQRVTPAATPPSPLVNWGTWKATRFLSFSETPGSPYGQILSGILTMEVELRPLDGQRRVTATMEVICNAPGGGLFTDEEEGVKLTLSDGSTFGPIGQGQTIINSGD